MWHQMNHLAALNADWKIHEGDNSLLTGILIAKRIHFSLVETFCILRGSNSWRLLCFLLTWVGFKSRFWLHYHSVFLLFKALYYKSWKSKIMHSLENWYFYPTEDLDFSNIPQEISRLKHCHNSTTSYIAILLFSMFKIHLKDNWCLNIDNSSPNTHLDFQILSIQTRN